MRYYCKFCGSMIEPGPNIGKLAKYFVDKPVKYCPLCGNEGVFVKVPEFETVEQWEKRTGKPYPDDRAVFGCDDDKGYWNYWSYKYAYKWNHLPKNLLVVAPDLRSPPADWRPE